MPATTLANDLSILGFKINPASVPTSVCARCGSSNLVSFNEEDEYGHAEIWQECRDCGSTDIIDPEEVL